MRLEHKGIAIPLLHLPHTGAILKHYLFIQIFSFGGIKLGKKEIKYFIGGTVGVVLGFTFAKIYHIWAIFYETKGLALEGVTS